MAWHDRPSWTNLQAGLDRTQADHFGELFEVMPMAARVNKRSVADPSRPAQRMLAVYITHDQASTPTARRMTEVAQREIVVEFNENDLPFNLRQGDRLTRCATGEGFEVLTPRSDGNGHMRAALCEFHPVD